MSKQYDQSNAAKKKFYSPIIPNLENGPIDKEDIMHLLNCNNRTARQEICDISMYYPVIAYSKRRGYRIINVKKTPIEKIDDEIAEIQLTLNDLYARVKTIKRKMKPLIAALKMLEKKKIDGEAKEKDHLANGLKQ